MVQSSSFHAWWSGKNFVLPFLARANVHVHFCPVFPYRDYTACHTGSICSLIAYYLSNTQHPSQVLLFIIPSIVQSTSWSILCITLNHHIIGHLQQIRPPFQATHVRSTRTNRGGKVPCIITPFCAHRSTSCVNNILSVRKSCWFTDTIQEVQKRNFITYTLQP